jgi:hypothetical protein
MDDISNSYLQQTAPLSDEEFERQEQLIISGAVKEPQSPLYSPEDTNLELDDIAVIPQSNPDVEDEVESEQPLDAFGYAKDIANGLATGFIDGGIEIAHTLGNVLDTVNVIGKLQGGDPENFTKMAEDLAPRLTPEDYTKIGLKVPVTTAGQITKSGAQFLTGFFPALKAMRGISGLVKGTGAGARTVAGIAGTGTAGAVADLSAFNPYEERISNWAKNSGITGLDNVVTQYLASDADDGELEGRLKQTLEGFFLGKAVGATVDVGSGIFNALKGYKQTKQMLIQEATGVPTATNTKPAYMVDPATGSRIETTLINPETGRYVDPTTGQDVNIPNYVLPIDKAPVRALPEEAQKDLAFKLLDGDVDGASRVASGLVNLKFIESEDGVKDLIESLAVARDQALGKTRRSWEEASAKSGTDIQTYSAKVAGLDTEVAKAEFARNAVAYKVQELSRIFKGSPSSVTEAEFKTAFKKLNVLDAMVSNNKSEIARALAIMRRKSDIGDVVEGIKAKAKDAVGLDGQTDWQKLATQIADMPDGYGVTNLVKAYNSPNWKDASTEVWVNNLFSPITLAKNLSATGISIGNSVVERYLGAGISMAKGSGELSLREANTYALGLLKAIPEALRVGWKSYVTEVPQFSAISNEFQEQLKHGAFRGEAFGIDAENSPLVQMLGKGLDYAGIINRSMLGGTRSLMATDELMKVMVYRAEAGALAQRQALKEGLQPNTPEFAQKIIEIDEALAKKDPNSPYYGLSLQATDEAHRRTFTEQLSEKGQALLDATRQFKSTYAVLPFIKTPVNLVKYMVRRTPALAGFSDYVEAELKAGGARSDLVQAQLASGAMYLASGMTLAGAGVLQGDITENWTVNRNLKALGIQQRSMVLEDGTQVNIGGFDGSPLSMMLLAGTAQETIEAYIRHNQDRMTDEELDAGIMEIMMIPMSAYMKYATNATWGQGVSALLNASQEDNWNQYASNMLANTVPNANTLKYANQQFGFDPFAREVDDAMDAVRAKLPQFSRDVAPRATLLGDPSEVPQYIAKGLVPTFTMTPPDHPVYMELNRLQRLDTNKVVLGGVPRVVEDVELDGVEQWNMTQFMRFMKVDGKDLLEQLEEVMLDPDYASATDKVKEDMLSKVYIKRKELGARALQQDTLAFHNGTERPYAETMRLYPYKRKSPLTDKIATEKALKVRDNTGGFGEDDWEKQDFINMYNDEIIQQNFIQETLQ